MSVKALLINNYLDISKLFFFLLKYILMSDAINNTSSHITAYRGNTLRAIYV